MLEPVDAAGDEPRKHSVSLVGQFVWQSLVPFIFRDDHLERHQTETTPDALITSGHQGLVVSEHHKRVGRIELPEVLPHPARLLSPITG